MATTAAVLTESAPAPDYARLEERILARDQKGASDVLYRIMKQGRPLTEITRETVRIHAPYTHVPYHQRLDDGIVKFVNNDHCFLSERVGLTLVQRGEVLPSYRVFLGLMQDVPNRRHVLAHLAFAGLIDVQDRMWHNRSYTTGHKGYRARATIELGEAIGWDLAHHVLYAGVPDMAVGPRWYSGYELGCNVIQNQLDGRDQELLAQTTPLTPAEEAMLVEVITRQREFSVVDALVALLKGGRSARRILDAIQVAAAQVILETGEPNNYSMAQHGYEYGNTVGWFYDTFEHPHRLKLLFVAALFINRGSEHQANTPGNGRRTIAPPPGSEGWSAREILDKLERALLALRADESVDLTAAYLKGGHDRAPLVQVLATAACKIGNDPHNQELGLCTLEDYLHTRAHDRDRLLLASAQHTAGHRKYGDPLEAYQRFAEAMGLDGR